MITTLSVTATPGKRYSFAAPGGPEQHTALSAMATPGGLRAFAPKGPSGAEQITDLSVWAIPGKRRYFIAKTPATPIPDPIDPPRGGSSTHSRIIREDEEILAVIMAAYHVLH